MKFPVSRYWKGSAGPGQAMVLSGPIACGETQLIKQIITRAMGGREAKTYSFRSGKTGFNADMLGAEGRAAQRVDYYLVGKNQDGTMVNHPIRDFIVRSA